MEEIYKAVEDRLNRLAAEIRGDMESKGVNASHRTERALSVYRYDCGVRLVIGAGDVAPLETLEVGRPGGRVPKGFYQIIKQWSRDKGIAFSSEKERSTFAYFLSRKIAREGTLRNKLPEEVYSSATRQALRDLYPIISKEFIRIITTKIR